MHCHGQLTLDLSKGGEIWGGTVHDTELRQKGAEGLCRRPLPSSEPEFCRFLVFPSIRKSQGSQILSAFRHFPREEMPDIKLLERLAPPQTASEGRGEGGTQGGDDGIQSFARVDWTAARLSAGSSAAGTFGRVFARTYAVPFVPFQAN